MNTANIFHLVTGGVKSSLHTKSYEVPAFPRTQPKEWPGRRVDYVTSAHLLSQGWVSLEPFSPPGYKRDTESFWSAPEDLSCPFTPLEFRSAAGIVTKFITTFQSKRSYRDMQKRQLTKHQEQCLATNPKQTRSHSPARKSECHGSTSWLLRILDALVIVIRQEIGVISIPLAERRSQTTGI